MVKESQDPNDFRHFFEDSEYPRIKLRSLGRDLAQLSESLDVITEEAIQLAKELQTANDLPFDVGDVIFHPGTGEIYEVNKVFDNSKRIIAGLGDVELQCKSVGGELVTLSAFKVLHFGYLLGAKGDWESTLEFSKALTAWYLEINSLFREDGSKFVAQEDEKEELRVDMEVAWQSAKAVQAEAQLKTETQLQKGDTVICEGDQYTYVFVGIDANTNLAVLTRPGIKENNEPDEVIKNVEFTDVVSFQNMEAAVAMHSNRDIEIMPIF